MSYDATRKSIYLAGFDVFLPNAIERGEQLKQLCREFGFEGLFPLDNQPPPDVHGKLLAAWIFHLNREMIRKADYVVANLNEFRGPGEPDAGTVWEVGYASGIGKPVWGYTASNRSLRMRISHSQSLNGPLLCDRGYIVEDFGLPMNLMIACSTQIVFGNARDCLKAIAAHVAALGVQT
jgi:nucleoside 2-deoxyribosyltransferase